MAKRLAASILALAITACGSHVLNGNTGPGRLSDSDYTAAMERAARFVEPGGAVSAGAGRLSDSDYAAAMERAARFTEPGEPVSAPAGGTE